MKYNNCWLINEGPNGAMAFTAKDENFGHFMANS